MKNYQYLINIDKEKFKQNRDYLMRVVEKDLKLIAWICWGLELLFKDFSYHEMFDFIGTATEEELSKYLVLQDSRIQTESNNGVIFDCLYELRDNGKVVGYLNIENQLKMYPLIELDARGCIYLCSFIYWEADNLIDRKHYRNIKPITGIWIFPKCPKSRKNNVIVEPIQIPSNRLKYNFNINGSLNSENIKRLFELNLKLFFYYLGNPLAIPAKLLKSNIKAGKLAILLKLLDTLFTFDLSGQERINIAKTQYNLIGENLDKEVEYMDSLSGALDEVFRMEHQELFEELNEEKQKNIQKDKLILKLDQERSKLEEEINVLKQKVLELSKNSNSNN